MNRTEKIQKYLDGSMSEVELLEFKEKLKIDPDLVAELDIHRLTNDVVAESDEVRFRGKLSEAYENYSDKKQVTIKKTRTEKSSKIVYSVFSLAAAVIVAIFFLMNPMSSSSEKLYSKYYETFMEDYTSRSASMGDNTILLEEAVKLYMAKNYTEALTILEAYSSEEQKNSATLNFYMGLTQIGIDDFDNAENSLKQVLSDDFNFLQEHSQWYLSLVYLKMGKYNLAEENLLEIKYQESIYSKRAKNILQRLPQ